MLESVTKRESRSKEARHDEKMKNSRRSKVKDVRPMCDRVNLKSRYLGDIRAWSLNSMMDELYHSSSTRVISKACGIGAASPLEMRETNT